MTTVNRVPLVVYANGERVVVGEAQVQDDGMIYARINKKVPGVGEEGTKISGSMSFELVNGGEHVAEIVGTEFAIAIPENLTDSHGLKVKWPEGKEPGTLYVNNQVEIADDIYDVEHQAYMDVQDWLAHQMKTLHPELWFPITEADEEE